MKKYNYIVMGHDNSTPFVVFDDYHNLIMYIRRQKFDNNKIYKVLLNEWYQIAQNISELVYENAYNEFNHWTDKNY